jgi:hypothetical protein
MNKNKLIAMLFIPLFILIIDGVKCYSQTADEIIAKHIEALGGIEKINSISNVRITGKFGSGSFELPFIQIVKRPYCFYMEMTIQGMTMKQAYDGNAGWKINPFQGKTEAESANEQEIKFMKDMSDIEGKLVNYKDKGYTVEYSGKEDLEGSEVYKLKLTEPDSTVTYYFIDIASNLLIKESHKVKIKEKELNQDIYSGDYKLVDGFMMAHSYEIKTPGAGMGESQKATVEKVEFNIEIDDTIFQMPKQ